MGEILQVFFTHQQKLAIVSWGWEKQLMVP